MAEVLEKLGRHDQALDNGHREFERLRGDLVALGDRVKPLEPKSPDLLKIGAFLLSLIIAILAGWWKLSAMLNERPTKGELAADRTEQKLLQEQQSKEIRAIHDQQIEQSSTLRVLQQSADKTNQRLDQLLSDKRPTP